MPAPAPSRKGGGLESGFVLLFVVYIYEFCVHHVVLLLALVRFRAIAGRTTRRRRSARRSLVHRLGQLVARLCQRGHRLVDLLDAAVGELLSRRLPGRFPSLRVGLA